MKLLDDWHARDHIIGCCCDTCSVNLGCDSGCVTVMERELGHVLLKCECCRHVTEIHVGYYCASISMRDPKAPYDALFKKIYSYWDKLKIDYSNLVKFNWSEDDGSWKYEKARESLSYMEDLLSGKSGMFKRGDYKNLALLVMVYLGGDDSKFRFPKPCATNSARFMQLPLYYLPAELLSNQIDRTECKITDSEWEEIEIMAEFSALFFSPWFFSCNKSSDAPYNDRKMINDMKMYRKSIPDDHYHCTRIRNACEEALRSMYRHSQYLSPELVVFGFTSKKISPGEKMEMAKSLMSVLAEKDEDQFKVHPKQKRPAFDVLKVWPDEEMNPSLSRFISKESLSVFYLLGVLDDMEWLELSPDLWDTNPGYGKFHNYVSSLEVVNDVSERSVKLCQDYIKSTTKEENLQNHYVVVAEGKNQTRSEEKVKTKSTLKRLPLPY